MDEVESNSKLSRQEISAAITDLGWRYILGAARTSVRTGSLTEAAAVAERVITAVGPEAGQCLRVDIRADRVILTLQELTTTSVTRREIDLAHRISAALSSSGHHTDADVGGSPRAAQILEIGIDTLDRAAIRPFWKAILGYIDEPGETSTPNGLADPLGQGPSVWFQQMDEPREQRNRIHFDISVPHDEAQRRIAAALAAGGTLLSDAEAPAFWVLADAEGNEACVTTWQGRDG